MVAGMVTVEAAVELFGNAAGLREIEVGSVRDAVKASSPKAEKMEADGREGKVKERGREALGSSSSSSTKVAKRHDMFKASILIFKTAIVSKAASSYCTA